MNSEFNRIKQVLINNGYTNTEVDHEIHKQLNKHHGETETKDKQRLETESKTNKVHHLYYRNEMNSQYRTDEKILRNILKKNIRCKNGNERVQLNIFYQNRKTHQLVMKNSPNTGQSSNRTNVVYKFTCPHEDCRPSRHVLHWCHDDDTVMTLDNAPAGKDRTGRALATNTSRK